MATMTTAASYRAVNAGQGQTAVDTAGISCKRIFDGNVIFLDNFRIAVTTPAGEGKLLRVHPRE